MSEEFDKEAEKEKLRQQLAEEEADREATQHMSELLLQGATMTNRHCSECGDPLFRHEGREFCPTCGRERGADTDAAEAAGDGGTEAVQAGQSDAWADAPSPAEAGGPSQATDQDERSPPAQPVGAQATGPDTIGEADLPAARSALARKVTALAQEAETTTDVGRARELLAAVREGAEALQALEEIGR